MAPQIEVAVQKAIDSVYQLYYGTNGDIQLVVRAVLGVLRYDNCEMEKVVMNGYYNRFNNERHDIHVYKWGPGGSQGFVDTNSIFQVIDSVDIRHNDDDYMNQCMSIVNDMRQKHASTREYILVIDHTVELMDVFRKVIRASESKVVTFFNHMFNSEIRQLPNLQLVLEESGLFLHGDVLANNLYSKSSLFGFDLEDLDLDLDLDLANRNHHRGHTFHGFKLSLGFNCSDSILRDLFYLFVQIFHYFRPGSISDQDFTFGIHLMLSVYKLIKGFSWYELGDYRTLEIKLLAITSFFIHTFPNTNLNDTIIPLIEHYDFFPEMVVSSSSNNHISTSFNSTNHGNESIPNRLQPSLLDSQILPEEDKYELFHSISEILPQLHDLGIEFDHSFLSIFKTFVNKVTGSDITEITTEADFIYLNEFIKLVNDLVAFENDESPNSNDNDISQVALNVFELHKKLSVIYSKDVNPTLLMRECIFVTNENIKKLQSIVKKWNRKILEISQLQYLIDSPWKLNSSTSLASATFSCWYNSYYRLTKMLEVSASYNDKKVEIKTLNSWKQKLNSYDDLQGKYLFKLCVKRWNNWKSKIHSLADLNLVAINHDYKVLNKKVFDAWKKKSERNRVLFEEADEFNQLRSQRLNSLSSGMFFRYWYNQFDTMIDGTGLLSHKLRILNDTREYFIKKKYFNTLKLMANYQARINHVRINSIILLKEHFFNKWSTNFSLLLKAEDFKSKQTSFFAANLLRHWCRVTILHNTASKFYTEKRLQQYWKFWSLQLKSNKFNDPTSTTSSIKLAVSFKEWKLRANLHNLMKNNNWRIQKLFMKLWIQRTQKVIDLNHLSDSIIRDNLLKKYFSIWLDAEEFQRNLPLVADSYMKKKFLMLMKDKYTENKKLLNEKLNQFLQKQNHTLVNRLPLKICFNIWQEKNHLRFEQSAQLKVEQFNQGLVIPNRKSRFLITWVIAYNDIQTKKQECYGRLQVFQDYSQAKSLFFNKWKENYSEKTHLKDLGTTFELKMLYKKYLVIWFDRYINKSLYLNELCQEMVDQRELKRLREILSEWSMKYIKYITRNQQSCDIFTKRWETSRMKSLFELWVYKLRNGQSQKSFDNFFDDNSMSFIDQSPLAIKRIEGINTESEQEPKPQQDLTNESYLNSPVKSQLRAPKTPQVISSNNISPTRFQTSLRMRDEKLKALKEHYSRARGTSTTPGMNGSRKPYSFSERVPVLSPPKRPNFSNLQVKPEKSEGEKSEGEKNHETIHEMKQEPINPNTIKSEPNDFYQLDNESTPSIPSQNDIETAKRLRRITPIFVPTADYESRPKLSPVITIKQRNSLPN